MVPTRCKRDQALATSTIPSGTKYVRALFNVRFLQDHSSHIITTPLALINGPQKLFLLTSSNDPRDLYLPLHRTSLLQRLILHRMSCLCVLLP